MHAHKEVVASGARTADRLPSGAFYKFQPPPPLSLLLSSSSPCSNQDGPLQGKTFASVASDASDISIVSTVSGSSDISDISIASAASDFSNFLTVSAASDFFNFCYSNFCFIACFKPLTRGDDFFSRYKCPARRATEPSKG